MGDLGDEDRKQLGQVITDYSTERKAATQGPMPAREMLDAVGADLKDLLRQAKIAVVVWDEMGPNVGEILPDFNLKLVGSEDRVRLSSFKGHRPVALIFGNYT